MNMNEHDDECTHDCATCGADCSENDTEQNNDALHHLSIVNRSIMIASAKGGNGKSVITSLLANELSKKGYRVGIIDGDLSSGSISLLYGCNHKPEIVTGAIHPVITNNNIRIISFSMLLPNPSVPLIWDSEKCVTYAKQFWTDVIWDNIDYLLIDTPSDTGDITQMFFNLSSIDGIIFVTDPSEIGNIITARSINYASICNMNTLGVIENFADRATSDDHAQQLANQFEIPMLDKLSYDSLIYQHASGGMIGDLDTDLLHHTIAMLEKL